MVVTVSFLGTQRTVTGKDAVAVTVRGEARVADVLHYIQHEFPGLGFEAEAFFAAVNHEKASLDRKVRDGDIVTFLPPIGGG